MYVHPLAVSLILIAISFLARISYKFSLFISRGIIGVICFLFFIVLHFSGNYFTTTYTADETTTVHGFGRQSLHIHIF